MSEHLPTEIRKMVKQPYRAPDAKCFSGGAGEELVTGMLSTDCIEDKGYFNPLRVQTLVSKWRENSITGFKDNMAFVGILSTQLLDKLFISEFRSDRAIDPSLVRRVESHELNQS
jgi:asparagine synthase (glutamine-hydrolysing)